MSTAHEQDNKIHELSGQDLLRHLRGKWEPLPNKTLFGLMLAGLKVRVMRSTITMVSIVLAIAFLSYMGLSGALAYSLSSGVRELEESRGPELSSVRQAAHQLESVKPSAVLKMDVLKEAGRQLGWTEVDEVQRELKALEGRIQKDLRTSLDRIQATYSAMAKEDREGSSVEISLNRAKQQMESAVAQAEVLRELLLMAEAVQVKQLSEAQTQLIVSKVDKAWSDSMASIQRQGRVDSQYTNGLVYLIHQLQGVGYPESTQVIRDFLDVEAKLQVANDLTMILHRAGVNIQETLGGSQMDTWLIVMSLLLCTVGIANAMLMSVTERFREIGTMKCLGASDSLVVKIFLMESSMLGVIGAFIGMILGIVVSLLAALIQYGSYGLVYFPISSGLNILLSSLGVGVLLAIMGTVYPALLASRMKPVDALRVDE
jgi:hypothetical protein